MNLTSTKVRELNTVHDYRGGLPRDSLTFCADFTTLRSILLRVSSLITGEDLQTDQVRDKNLFFMTETLRVSVYTGTLPSVTSRFNLKATMIPVGAIHGRTRRMVCRLTGGRGVDMKDESHISVPYQSICAMS
jgi:hypothetical protein